MASHQQQLHVRTLHPAPCPVSPPLQVKLLLLLPVVPINADAAVVQTTAVRGAAPQAPGKSGTGAAGVPVQRPTFTFTKLPVDTAGLTMTHVESVADDYARLLKALDWCVKRNRSVGVVLRHCCPLWHWLPRQLLAPAILSGPPSAARALHLLPCRHKGAYDIQVRREYAEGEEVELNERVMSLSEMLSAGEAGRAAFKARKAANRGFFSKLGAGIAAPFKFAFEWLIV